MEEKEGETSNVDAGPEEAEEDRITYVTPNTEVHSGVFVDEVFGDTIVEVTSPILGKKKRTRNGPLPCAPHSPSMNNQNGERMRSFTIHFSWWIILGSQR